MFGDNTYNQVGDGTTVSKSLPIIIGTSFKDIEVAATAVVARA